MSQKIRQGNDIRIRWSILDADEHPYILEGRNVAVELNVGTKRVRIKSLEIESNVLIFTYYGKDQKYTGSYILKFIENEGQVDMVTFDTKDAFTLVEHSWQAIDEGETPETVQLEFVTVTSALHSSVGPAGDPAGFGEVTASVDGGVGTPSVEVTTSGPDTAKNFAFSFHNLKGQDGSDAEVTAQNIQSALGYVPVAPADISQFITKTVDDLTNYYLKSETYTKAEVEALVAGISGVSFVVANSLPTASASTMGKIYLIPSADPQTQNVKDEFITLESGGSYSWEQIGSTAIDLDGYVTDAELQAAIAAKQDIISDLATIRSGAAAGATAYQKPATGIPASDLASGVIPAPEVFIAEYGVTTLAEVMSAYNAGKFVALDNSGDVYVLCEVTNQDVTFCRACGPNVYCVYLDQDGFSGSSHPIPTALSELSDDSTHRLVTDTEKDKWDAKANVADLEDGTLVPALAGNLKSWNDRSEQNVESAMTDTHRSTAGDESVNADSGATLLSIIATSDFSASKLIASGFNLLRLQSNNGLAVAIGAGWYFPVPTLTFGAYGTAEQNNGVLFTDSEGNNLTPTVRFQPLADGVPTSVNDGSVCEYTDSNGKRFYTTPGPGWLIVTGITWATTCAHMAWSMLYDKFVAPDDADDAGTIIDLSALGTMRVVGSGAGLISDRADRISATQMRLTAYVGRVQPAWTRGAQDEEAGLYPYTATISGIKSGGIAEFEGDDKPEIIVEGTTLTYYSDSSTALTDYVKYQLATPTTANKNVATGLAHINDWGIDALIGASGSAIINLQYAQGIPDALVQLLSKIDNSTVPVIAAAFAWMDARIRILESRLIDAYNRIDIYAKKVYAEDIFVFNTPMILESLEAGAPAAARVPKNWNQDTMGVWSGVPKKVGQVYIDRSAKKVYVATNLSNSTNDWSLMN